MTGSMYVNEYLFRIIQKYVITGITNIQSNNDPSTTSFGAAGTIGRAYNK